MTLNDTKPLVTVLRDLIREELAKGYTFDIYLIKNLCKDEAGNYNYTADILHPIMQQKQYSKVPIMGMGIGNYKGLLTLPAINDNVVVLFMGENVPIIIGSLPGSWQNLVPIQSNELFLSGQSKGSYLFIDSANNVKIQTTNASIIIKEDGSITINGNSVNIAGGSPTENAARLGDAITGMTDDGHSVTGTIVSGSAKVLIG